MKLLMWFALVAAPSASFAAKPFVCFTSKPAASAELIEEAMPIILAGWGPMACEDVGRLTTGLQATSLVFSATGFTLACTGVGLPATVWLQGGALGTRVLSLVVGLLPCDNGTRDAQIKEMAQNVVCAELAKHGIACALNR